MPDWTFDPNLPFSENRRNRCLALGLPLPGEVSPAKEGTSSASGELYPDSVPDLADEPISDAAERLNALADSIGILEVYDRLLGWHREKAGSRSEGIKVTCPCTPKETHPSAWVNTEKEVLRCGHESGLDMNKYGLYRFAKGLDDDPQLFHLVKRLMVFELRGIDPYLQETE